MTPDEVMNLVVHYGAALIALVEAAHQDQASALRWEHAREARDRLDQIRKAVDELAREHVIQVAGPHRILQQWLDNPNGSLGLGNRVTFEAVANGDILVRTKPYRYEGPA